MASDRRDFLFGAGLVAGLGFAAQAAAQPSTDATRSQMRLSSAASFIALPRSTASVMVRGNPAGTLVCETCLDVPDETLRDRVPGLTPRLRDAITQTLTTYATVHMRPTGAPDPDHLGRLLQVAVDRVCGQAGARVLIVDLMMQARTL